ncbi:MAG: hypothetical protein ACXABE_17830 [Candidatus Thorarchaeota archaeon]|jgi:hypothetical protein
MKEEYSKKPMREIIVLCFITGKSYSISGNPEEHVRDILFCHWPFEAAGKEDEWLMEDQKGNDISGSKLCDINGFCTIYFGQQRSPIVSDDSEY